ncbi:uncharacterized protein [Ptychodera flava]|uniref:uncharacterized protein n=1 Tax=Ptychodera flava TaxID=63121 RepID=UPI00396A7482
MDIKKELYVCTSSWDTSISEVGPSQRWKGGEPRPHRWITNLSSRPRTALKVSSEAWTRPIIGRTNDALEVKRDSRTRPIIGRRNDALEVKRDCKYLGSYFVISFLFLKMINGFVSLLFYFQLGPGQLSEENDATGGEEGGL